MIKALKITLLVTATVLTGAFIYAPHLDSYNAGGNATVAELSGQVRVLRDAKGMPYIFAGTPLDAIRGQGFVTAQDRLFQLEMMRNMAWGRLSEMIGDAGISMDTQVHLWNVPELAQRQVGLLNQAERDWHLAYVEGINAYLSQRADELSILVQNPQPWKIEDVIAIQYFNITGSSTNWREELLSQALIDRLGASRAAEISQITINPDDSPSAYTASNYQYLLPGIGLKTLPDTSVSDGNGSNAWVTGSSRSAGNAPIVASDPHIDARRLPGFWYPVALITPHWRAVGAGAAGTPGLGIGRTSHFAWGVTNGYGDVVDLYIESIDPNNAANYLEGAVSTPFTSREVILRVRDDDTDEGFRKETLVIRETKRGPVISDHGMTVNSGKVITRRWAVPEFIGDNLGMRNMLLANTIEDALKALNDLAIPLTYVLADYDGNIARKGTGYLPNRLRGDGAAPFPITDSTDNWNGRIPGDEMPTVRAPAQDWVGSANHRIVPQDYPYVYSTFFAHSWRYRRMLEAMQSKQVWSARDHWQLQLDTKNMYAQRLAPLMAAALREDKSTEPLGELLENWNLMDDSAQAAPLVFQSMLRHYARHVVEDELGKDLAAKYLNDYYYWHERIAKITLDEESRWLDNNNTNAVEDRDALFKLAGQDVLEELTLRFGNEPRAWNYGEAHTITFSHNVLQGDTMAQWFGGGTHPASGSGETINRAAYKYHDPYKVTFFASMRMVADLSDPDKVEAHIPGGTTDRLFHPQFKNHLGDWTEETPNYWWFSDEAIESHAVSELVLEPAGGR